MQSSSFLIGPHRTPRSVAILIWTTVLISILSPIVSFAFSQYTHLAGPQEWMPLSLEGIKQGWFWQLITYCFVHSTDAGISISLLFFLCLQMFLLWFAGSEVASRFGTASFLMLYLSGTVISGLVAASLLFLFSSPTLVVGSAPAVYTLLVLWTMLYPDLELFFFFIVRIKAKWLAACFLGLSLLINLSYGHFILFAADATGILWGFLAGLIIWKLPNPYQIKLSAKRKKHPPKTEKIIDINVFHEDDEAFMDRMLEKIARQGEAALTKRERDRMQKISLRKKSEEEQKK